MHTAARTLVPGIAPLYALAVLVLTGLVLAPSILTLAQSWQTHPDYSHGWFVGIIGMGLLGQLLRNTSPGEQRPHLGLGLASCGGLVLLTSNVIPWPLLAYFGWISLILGILFAIGGTSWARASLRPLLFLAFMFPLPVVWTDAIARWLQVQVATVTAAVVTTLWTCVQHGTVLHLAGLEQPIVVAEACSGLRQMLAFLGLAVLLGTLLDRRGWQFALLLILAIPCAIVANVLRVLLLVATVAWLGSEGIEGILHELPSAITLPLGVGMFLLVIAVLPAPAARKEGSSNGNAQSSPPQSNQPAILVLLATLILLQACLAWHLRAAEVPAEPNLPQPLAELPYEFKAGEVCWKGSPTQLTESRSKALSFADQYIHRQYRDSTGVGVAQVFVSFSSTAKDRQHHPEICVREVGGASELVEHRQPIHLAENATALRFAFVTSNGRPLTIYYWHYTLTDLAASQNLTLLQRIHLRSTHRPASVTVQVSTETALPNSVPLENTLLPQLHDALLKLLPPQVRIGHDRLAVRVAIMP